MAQRQQAHPIVGADRNEATRTAPRPLRTQDLAPNRPFSFTETPTQAHEPVFHQFSSPTDSTIDESPLTPMNHQSTPYIPETDRRSPYPEEKTVPNKVDLSYNAPDVHVIHPAHYAPYAEASPSNNNKDLIPQQPPFLTQQSQPFGQPHQKRPSEQTFEPPPVKASDNDRKQSQQQYQMTARTPTYNPDSLAGPNAAVDNHRPGQVSHPNAIIQPEWKHGLCEIDTLCCTGLFCPCMVYGRTQYRLSQKAQRKEATDLLGYEAFNGQCGLMAAACGFQWVFALIQHTRIRKLYKLDGSIGDDCIKSFCCCPCVLMQNEREVRSREELIRRHAGPSSGAYITPDTMTYAPPPR
ncbi:hypothetical protein MMC13_007521 [Lambiella insularis]|nr:hypothetical protein [Lambiella insularis]